MKFAYALAAALGGLLVALPATADSCRTGYAPAYNNHAVAVVNPTVVLPLYGAAYTGEADAETADLLKQLLAEIRALRADLQKGPPPAGPSDTGDGPPVAPLKTIDVGAVVKAKCASCHTGDAAKSGFEMVTDKGDLVKLNGLSRKAVRDRVDGKGGGPMPPPKSPQLTPAEKEALKKALTDPIPEAKK
jgi:mono/diheme cytochrome c family protein